MALPRLFTFRALICPKRGRRGDSSTGTAAVFEDRLHAEK
jgi:hypothetical protein